MAKMYGHKKHKKTQKRGNLGSFNSSGSGLALFFLYDFLRFCGNWSPRAGWPQIYGHEKHKKTQKTCGLGIL
jgi:hypothetical protein